MDSAEVKVNTEEVMKMFSEFNAKFRKQVFRTAINKSLQIVKKQSLVNLSNVVEPDKINFKDKWGNTLKKGIKTKVYKSNKSGVIHILNNFKLKFFEMGTDDRYNKRFRGSLLRKKRYTGKIKASHFFTRAKESKETEVFSTIEKHLVDAITRINNKYKGK